MMSRPAGLTKLKQILSSMIYIQERELYFGDCIKAMCKTGWRSDASALFSFKLGMVIDTAKLCTLLLV